MKRIVSIILIVLTLILIYFLIPKIKLDSTEVTLNYNEKYSEGKVSARNVFKDYTKDVKVLGKVDTKKVGKYKINYVLNYGMLILKRTKTVNVVDKKFVPTEIGIETTDKLQEFFKDIINVKYTKEMEDDLDKIADGDLKEIELLKRFYDEFEPKVKDAFSNMEKKPAEETGEMCPNCGSPLVIKQSRYGKFVACSNYPECKYIKNNKEEKQVVEIMDCPKCKDGKVIERKTKRGKIFYGCSNYPKCDFASWDKPTGEFCPECNNYLVEKKDKIKCSSCNYEK